MISMAAEYALRSVVTLGLNPDRCLTAREIAEQTEISVSYLYKILQMLVRAGLIASHRGLGGGFDLACPPADDRAGGREGRGSDQAEAAKSGESCFGASSASRASPRCGCVDHDARGNHGWLHCRRLDGRPGFRPTTARGTSRATLIPFGST